MKPDFDPTVAQDKVKILRQHLRQAKRYHEQGEASAAAEQDRLASACVTWILGELEGMFRSYAGTIPDFDARKDARSLMMVKIWQAITDISDSPEARRYEYNFWTTVKWRFASIVKKIREQEKERLELLSLDALKPGEKGETTGTWADDIVDKDETGKVSKLLDEMVWQLFLEQIPSPKHKIVFLARYNRATWEVAGKEAGITAKTAAKYGDEMFDILTRLLKAEIGKSEPAAQRTSGKNRKRN